MNNFKLFFCFDKVSNALRIRAKFLFSFTEDTANKYFSFFRASSGCGVDCVINNSDFILWKTIVVCNFSF